MITIEVKEKIVWGEMRYDPICPKQKNILTYLLKTSTLSTQQISLLKELGIKIAIPAKSATIL